MSASTDSLPPAAWTVAGVGFVLVLAAGLAAGLWPRVIYPAEIHAAGPQLPTLGALAVAHMAWVVLAWPLVLARQWRGSSTCYLRSTAAQLGLQIIVASPLYAMAAWFADATATDVVRVILAIALLSPFAAASGAWYGAQRKGAWGLLLGVLVVTLGLPGVYYLAAEFFRVAGDAQWIWDLSPLTHAWSSARARAGIILPRPLWAGGVHVAMGGIVALLGMLAGPGSLK